MRSRLLVSEKTDLFMKAATRFGKSVRYTTTPHVYDYLYRFKTDASANPSFSSMVVISPLNALIEDQ